MEPGLPELGRFAEPSLYILVSLSSGPRHGYAIKTDVESISGVPLGPGTLYGALVRLERRGLIEALPTEDRRRPYRLTELGAATLEAQLASLEGFVRTGLARLESARDAPARPAPRRGGSRGASCSGTRSPRQSGCGSAELGAGTLGFLWPSGTLALARVKVGTLSDLVTANPGLPVRQGFPAYVPAARAFVVLVDPARGRVPARGRTRRAMEPTSTSGRSTSVVRTSAAARTRASRTSGSTARATSRAMTAWARRPSASSTGPPSAGWTGSG